MACNRATVWVMLMFLAAGVSGAELPATQPLGSAVFLTIGVRPPWPTQTPLLSWELYRQAILIAARDGLGLQTRDESLREWKTSTTPDDELTLSFDGTKLELEEVGGDQHESLWHGAIVGNGWWVEDAEKLSRDGFVAALQQHGWKGKGNTIRPDAPLPAGVEDLLKQFDELSQFSAVRLIHAAIAADGESPIRLGALVRGYANLCQLTRLQISPETEVYGARALLYARRMVAADPTSAFALWHQAYARSMVGLQRWALDDLKQASHLKSSEAPAWLALLEPYCRYQTDELQKRAAADPSLQPLASYLAFLTLENSGFQAATMNAAQAALTANPNCLRLVDAMCDETGPGMLNELTPLGPQMFSQLLGDRLDKVPGLPAAVIDSIHELRRPGGNPGGREVICQALIDAGDVHDDRGEPSWAALGRMIQEITFAHVQRQASLIAIWWGVDASDYTSHAQPFVADHPYKRLIDAYGLVHSNNPAALQSAVSDFSTEQLTASALRLMSLEENVRWYLHNDFSPVWKGVFRNLDYTSYAMGHMLRAFNYTTDKQTAWMWDWLGSVSGESPALLVQRIREHWNPAQAYKLESEHWDQPAVSYGLATKYARLKQWADAERCFRECIDKSPDLRVYYALANVYKRQNQEAKWLATLKEFLTQKDYGLEHMNVEVVIAQYYMSKGKYEQAMPYADDAAQTGAAAGLICAAGARAGLGQWDEAESLIIDEMHHYDESPFRWFAWCVRLDHGNRAAAITAMHDYFASRQGNLNSEDLAQLARLYILEKKDDKALATFQKRAKRFPGPFSPIHIAVLADGLKDNQTRDQALQDAINAPINPPGMNQFAAALRDAVQKGPEAEPDKAAVEIAAKNADPPDRIAICYLTGRWHLDRGDEAGAIECFRGAIFGYTGYSLDLILAEDQLRQHQIDPLDLERAAVPQGHRISLEP